MSSAVGRRSSGKWANIAGLPSNYIVRQFLAFKNGDREGGRAIAMIVNSKLLSDEEMKSAADYFASLKPRPGYTKVVETDMVAIATFVLRGRAACEFATPDGAKEPIGNRIIVLPQIRISPSCAIRTQLAIERDPPGSIAKGARSIKGGEGKTITCTICHIPEAQGHRGGAEHRGPARDLHLPPARRHEDRQS